MKFKSSSTSQSTISNKKAELEKYEFRLGNTQEDRQIFIFNLVTHYADKLEDIFHENTKSLFNNCFDGDNCITDVLIN
jgi:hypothetical protein